MRNFIQKFVGPKFELFRILSCNQLKLENIEINSILVS